MDAPPEIIFEAITDFQSYPAWTANVKRVEILSIGADGRPDMVRYLAGALGFTAEYTLEYEFDPPREMRWVLVDGRLRGPLIRADIRHLDGSYQFERLENGRTLVTYSISAELSVPLGPLRRKAEQVIVTSALKELQEYVEV